MKIRIGKHLVVLLLIVLVTAIGCTHKSKSNENKILDKTGSTKIKSGDELQIIDISQKQLALYSKYLKTDSVQ